MALLAVEDLVVRFRTHGSVVYAVNGVSFELAPGETLGLVGESGCGKSVTSLAMMGLLPKPAGRVEGGRVMFDGLDLVTLSERDLRDIRGREIAMIFQDPMTSLNPVLTIEEQMVETIQAHKKTTHDEARKRAIELLAMVGIPRPENRLKSYPHEFSGGMRQRVMIAIGLACNPKLLIADEPTTALDVTIQAQILDLLASLSRDRNMAMVLITHDMGVVAETAQRVSVMYASQQVEEQTAERLFEQPRHPYTAALLEALPERASGKRLNTIPGVVPGIADRPSGCVFNPRCGFAQERCRVELPALEAKLGARVRCHFPIGGGTAS